MTNNTMHSIIAKEIHQTTCPYCGVGCGVTATVENNHVTSVKGREDHPANAGKLCVKGSALHETLDSDNRLLHPQLHGEQTTWDNALDYSATKWQAIVEAHGPDAVAFYLSGQLLTEDYYVANKLLKGFVGTANIDTNSRLCMASAVVAHKRAFGADAVPACYDDLEETDVLFIVGSNTAYAHPIIYQRIAKAKKERNFKVIVLDPRRTATCDIADLHLAIRPGSDAFFFNGLLSYLADNNAINQEYIRQFCDNYDSAVDAARSHVPDIQTAASICDVNEADLNYAYSLFAQNEKVVTLFSQGINQSSSGVDKGNSIINCHLATGKIGKPGAAPFSITGQPNAMGGREVGGLANQFAAHMGFTEDAIERVETFWQAPNIAKKEGLKAVDMFEAVHSGKIKAIWIMATNPVVSMPQANRVKEALEKCELVIVSDCMANTDTARTADVLLPATSWSEKHGTVTNSERCISLQKGFMPPAGEARHDWQIMSDFAKRLGFGTAFDYQHPVDIFREHATLSGLDNTRSRAFNISGLADISLEDYENFRPKHWPIIHSNSNSNSENETTKRLFTDGYFYTENNRAKLLPIQAQLPKIAAQAQQLVMNTGRIRDQWHTMTRTGKAPRLHSHTNEPYVQIHPNDALNLNSEEGDLLELKNQGARYLGRIKIAKDQRAGEIFVPMHWTSVYASFGRVDALINPIVDPISGQPEFKQSPVKAKKYAATWHATLVSLYELEPQSDYWAKNTLVNGYHYQLASHKNIDNHQTWLENHFQESVTISDKLTWTRLHDSNGDSHRLAAFDGDKLIAVLCVARQYKALPEMHWLSEQIGLTFHGAERFKILAASSEDASLSTGAMICSCYQVGENTIKAAIEEGICSVEALGNTLKCGTNCGSCIPELSAFIEEQEQYLATEALS